jgi:hypothetical protein
MRTPTKGQPPERLTRDDVLDNITLYWLTTTGVSSARSYWDNKPPYFGRKNFSIPAAVTVFPGEIYQPSRRWAEGGYSNLSYFHEVDKGGHFAAWEEPLLFASEMRATSRTKETTVTTDTEAVAVAQAPARQASEDTSIRPFHRPRARGQAYGGWQFCPMWIACSIQDVRLRGQHQ